METRLGKLSKVKFGFGGYQDSQVGLSVTIDMVGSGVQDFIGGGWSFPPDKYCKWTIQDQTNAYGGTLRKVTKLMKEAKVDDVSKLEGKPVEVTLDGNLLQSWRILTEVL